MSFQQVIRGQNVSAVDSKKVKNNQDPKDMHFKLLRKSRIPLPESREDSQQKPLVISSTASLPQTLKLEDNARRKSTEYTPGSRVQLKVTLAQTTSNNRKKENAGNSRDRSGRNEGNAKEPSLTYLEKIKIEINHRK